MPSFLPDLMLALAILTPVLTVAAAYYSVKFGLNGTREDVAELKRDTAQSLTELKREVREVRKAQGATATSVAVCQSTHQERMRWLEDQLVKHLEKPRGEAT